MSLSWLPSLTVNESLYVVCRILDTALGTATEDGDGFS